MKVLISDKMSESVISRLNDHGIEVAYEPGISHDRLMQLVPATHGLIVRSATRVTAEVIAAAKLLRVIGRAGTGVDNIDVAAATASRIAVLNSRGANSTSAAEHTFALMIALARKIAAAHASVVAGKWERSAFMGMELSGKSLGIVGIGQIGKEVASRALAFGMHVFAYDPFLSAAEITALGVQPLELPAMLRQCHFITFHLPLNSSTRHMISHPQLDQANRSLHIINVSRGGIIDEPALQQALVQGKIAGAALDVFENEPPGENRFAGLDNVIMTPHLGASTMDAQERIATVIADGVAAYLLRNETVNLVNPAILQLNPTTN